MAMVEAAFKSVIEGEEKTTEEQNQGTREKMDIFVFDGSHEKMVPDVVGFPFSPLPSWVPFACESNLLLGKDDIDLSPPGDLLARKATLIEINEAIEQISYKQHIIETLIKKATEKKVIIPWSFGRELLYILSLTFSPLLPRCNV